jgi:hypothetical protein
MDQNTAVARLTELLAGDSLVTAAVVANHAAADAARDAYVAFLVALAYG